MNSIEVSSVLQSQFPEHYQNEGPNLIAFIQKYYDWYAQSGYDVASEALELRDIDETVDSFLVFFKSQYLKDLPNLTQGDLRRFIKNSDDFYDTRGTIDGIQLFFRQLYGKEVEVYIPSTDIFRTSDGKWHVPTYLEISPSPNNKELAGKQITGSTTGTKAFVEAVVRHVANGAYFDVLYLSNLTGDFLTGEIITYDGSLIGASKIIGSLNSIDIINGGRNNSVGDIFDIYSASGKQAKARVTATENGTGRVDFTIIDGGTGYTTNALTLVSNTVLTLANTEEAQSLTQYETIEQKIANISFLSANASFTIGDQVDAYTAGTWIRQGSGTIIELNQSNTTGYMKVFANNFLTDEFRFADTIRKSGNSITALINTTTDVSPTANVIGSNTQYLGVVDNVNTLYSSNTGIVARGRSSNSYVHIYDLSTGSGADFSVGSLTNEETVLVDVDRLAGFNSANVRYLNISLNGEGSGVGFVDKIVVGQRLNITGVSGTFGIGDILSQSSNTRIGKLYFANSTVLYAYPTTNTFTTGAITDSHTGATATVSSVVSLGGTGYSNSSSVTLSGGGQSVTAITINNGGSGYANGERLIFNSNTGSGALATVTTNSIGGIVSFNIVANGQFYTVPPTITINTTSGINASLTAVLGKGSQGTATVTTNSTGGITSFTINAVGSGYFYSPTVSIANGTNANVFAVIDYGYGFPKNTLGDFNSIINSVLTKQTFTLGTIASLTRVAPGQNYNRDPIVNVVEPDIAAFNKTNLNLFITNASGSFIAGEQVSQLNSTPTVTLSYTGLTGNTGFELQEYVTQGNTSGVVYYRDATTVQLQNVSGTFINTTNVATKILGVITNATANVSNVSITTANNTVKGLVLDNANSEFITIRRNSFNYSFGTGSIVGLTSGTTATVTEVVNTGEAMGDNADISAVVKTANGIATAVEVIDSGFGYIDAEEVELVSNTSNFVITGIANLNRQGSGEGYWKSTDSFISADKYLQDGSYYQDFSYDIKTDLSLERYVGVLKKLLHIAGTEVFGTTVIKTELKSTSTLTSSIVSQAVSGDGRHWIFYLPDNSPHFITTGA